MNHLSIDGLIAATYTPLNTDGSLNLDVIGKYVDHLIESGVTGLFVCGTTGEGMSLTAQERRDAAAAYVEVAGNRCPVIIQVGHNSLQQAAELAEHAQSIGAAAISATCPSYFKTNAADVLVQCMNQVAERAAETPFYYYHIPGMTGSHVDMTRFLELGRTAIPNLRGIKFSWPVLHEFRRCLTFDPERYDMFWGVDEMLLGALAFGARAAVGSTYNVLAPVFCRMIECFERGDLAAARQWQDRAIQFVHTTAPFSFHPAMKQILGMLGIEMGPCRLPLPGLSAEGADDLRRQLDKIEFFEWCSPSRI